MSSSTAVPPDSSAWLPRTRTFLGLALLVLVIFGLLVRTRIQFAAALPSDQPWLWHLLGVAEDVFSAAVVAVFCLLGARGPRSAAVMRRFFGLIVLVLCVLHLVKSEAVLMFGTAVGPHHFRMGPVFPTILRSIRDYSGTLLVGSVVGLIIALWFAGRLARRVRLNLTLPRLLAVVTATAVIVFAPWQIHQRQLSRSPLLALTDLLLEQQAARVLESSSLRPLSEAERLKVRELAGVPRAFLSAEFPLAYAPAERAESAPVAPPGLRPNIVFVSVENLRTEEVGAYGARIAGVTPHIDGLAARGIRFDRAYGVGTYTPTAEIGLWYGLPGIPDLPLLHDNQETVLNGLPEILRAAGWRSFFWISSTDQTFFQRDGFYKPRGFQMFDGNDFPRSDPRVNWGVSDRALARRAAEALRRLPEPFAAMILTVNNHHPYQLPRDAGPPLRGLPDERRGYVHFGSSGQIVGLHAAQMIQTIHYSDQAVGDFFELASRESWFSRTIFVITGDHGVPILPLGRQVETEHELSELRFHVPLIIFSPLIEGGKVIAEPVSHADLLPVLLGIAGIRSPRAGLGEDVLGQRLDPSRPVFSWSPYNRSLRITTGQFVYYATVPALGFPDSGPLPSEMLIDPIRDPAGRQNLAPQASGEVERFRRLARIYAGILPGVVREGRSGLPSDDS